MSDTPRSEKELCLTRFSTPVPELDDHRFSMDPPRIETTMEDPMNQYNMSHQGPKGETLDRPDLLQAQDALRDPGPLFRDFEQAGIEGSEEDGNYAGRRFSADPTGQFQTPRRISVGQQDLGNISRKSSVSARSSSPPNSVEAFADPRRRERANTLDSHGPPDLEAMLQRTVSGGTQPRRPTFSNASAIRPQPGDLPLDGPEEACVITYDEPGRIPVIDYEELEEFVALNQKVKANANRRRHSMSSQSRRPRVFCDLRPGEKVLDVDEIKKSDSADSADTYRAPEDSEDALPKVLDEKELVENLPNINEPTRFGFFSSESQTTVHAADLGDLVFPGDSFRDLFQLGPDGGVWWLDVVNPTEEELGAISRAFSIHPLTTEDILTQEAREKVELFKQYYFVCFRTFFQMDKTSEEFLEPVNFYMVVFRDGVLTFSFQENPHASNVRKRIGKLRDYVSLSSDWICYAMM